MATWIACALIAFAAAHAVRKVYRDHKNGKGCAGCHGRCSGCPASAGHWRRES